MATKLEKIYKAPFMVEDYFLDLREKKIQKCDTWLEEFMENYPRKSNTGTCGTFNEGFDTAKLKGRR